MSKVIDLAEPVVRPAVEGLGLELVEIEYKKMHDQMHLTVFIDKDGGVGLDDCEAVHRIIDPLMDEVDPTAGLPYTLNVSSPGLDRPLKTTRDFLKNIERDVEVSLYAAIDGKKRFEAKLLSADDEIIRLQADDKTMTIERKNIAAVKPVIKF